MVWGKVCGCIGQGLVFGGRPCPLNQPLRCFQGIKHGHGLSLKNKPCPIFWQTVPQMFTDLVYTTVPAMERSLDSFVLLSRSLKYFSRTKTVSKRVNVAIKMLTESIKMLTQRIGIGDLLPGPPYLSRNFVRGQGLRWFWARLDFGLQTLPTESAFQVLSGHKAWARSVAQNQTVPNYLADRAPKNDRPCPVVR